MRHRIAHLSAASLAAHPPGGGGAPGAGASDTGGGFSNYNGDAFADLVIGSPGDAVMYHPHAGAVHLVPGRAGGVNLAGHRVLTQDSPGLQGSAESWDEFGAAVVTGDFNGDLRTDVAIGIPGETIAGAQAAGAVQVVYGGAGDITTTDRIFTQTGDGLDESEEGDWFGGVLATGDFDADGFADLAIGVPGESVGPVVAAGAVDVLYGSLSGLSQVGAQHFTLSSSGIPGGPATSDRFGAALAAARFDGVGGDDLAVGAPGQDLPGAANSGEVIVIRSGLGGLSGSGAQSWSQDSPGIADSAEVGDGFGSALAANAWGDDGNGDLAVGVPGENLGGVVDAGAVNVIQGSASGLSAAFDVFLHEDVSGMPGTATSGERFGSILGVGGVAGDIRTDLIVGVPDERLGGQAAAGAVYLIPTWMEAPETHLVELVYRGHGVPGSPRSGDRFGASVSAGQIDSGTFEDLVVGVPGDTIGGHAGAGSVEVVWGGYLGTGNHGRKLLSQATNGMSAAPRLDEAFGTDTAA